MMNGFAAMLRGELRHQRRSLTLSAACAFAVTSGAVLLLGLSGWFITAAAAAGLGGPIAARAFNYMLPAAAIRLLAIIRTGARYEERLAGHSASFAVMARLRPALFRAIASAPPAQALGFSSGEASAALVHDIGTVEMAVARRSASAGAIGAIGGSVVMLTNASASAALGLLVILALTLAMAKILSAVLERRSRLLQAARANLREAVAEALQGIAELRCYGIEDVALERIARDALPLELAERAQLRVAGLIEASSAFAVAVAAIGAFALAAPEGVALAALSALAAAMAVDGLGPLLRQWSERGAACEAASRLDRYFHIGPGSERGESLRPTLTLPGLATAVPGDRIAITGPSGSGKTSLIASLVGLGAARCEGVYVDHIPVQRLAENQLRSLFAWLPQDAQLLAGTVRENLALADALANDAVLWEALEDALIGDRVRAMPQGLDTWIGDNGERLSGGERRRLALARAYLAEAPWLLLDEPTEGLDRQTERQVIRHLQRRLNRTGQGLIAVTHRPALMAICGRRCEIEGERRSDKLAA